MAQAEGNQRGSVPCPQCGSRRTGVYSTRPCLEGVSRRRICLECGLTLRTRETYVGVWRPRQPRRGE